jgi:hypothetical protein
MLAMAMMIVGIAVGKIQICFIVFVKVIADVVGDIGILTAAASAFLSDTPCKHFGPVLFLPPAIAGLPVVDADAGGVGTRGSAVQVTT